MRSLERLWPVTPDPVRERHVSASSDGERLTRMAKWTDVAAAIESGAVDDPVVPFEGPAVLAVDVLGDFAAAFSYTWRAGQAMQVAREITFARYSEGGWSELRTNGSTGTACHPPWDRQRTGFGLFLGSQERFGFGYVDLPALIA